MLFAAFAAEAYVNEFIADHFTGRDVETLDRLSTTEKYVIAPRLALGAPLFERDREPLQTISKLFRQRDTLVHPKPGKGLPEPDRWSADPVYNPAQATIYICFVGAAAKTLVANAKTPPKVDMHAEMITYGAKGLAEYAQAATARLADPDDAPASPYLLIDATGLIKKSNGPAPSPAPNAER
jgi:hypothetical protein